MMDGDDGTLENAPHSATLCFYALKSLGVGTRRLHIGDSSPGGFFESVWWQKSIAHVRRSSITCARRISRSFMVFVYVMGEMRKHTLKTTIDTSGST